MVFSEGENQEGANNGRVLMKKSIPKPVNSACSKVAHQPAENAAHQQAKYGYFARRDYRVEKCHSGKDESIDSEDGNNTVKHRAIILEL